MRETSIITKDKPLMTKNSNLYGDKLLNYCLTVSKESRKIDRFKMK